MNPIRTDYSNITYVAEGCNDLPATLTKNPFGQDEVETCWELTDEEVEQVMKDKRVFLHIMGRSVPPLYMTTESDVIV